MEILSTILLAVAVVITGCNNNTASTTSTNSAIASNAGSNPTKEQRNKQIALECINAGSNGDMDKIVSHLADGSVDYGDGSTPPARGIDSVKFFAQLWNSSVKDYKANNELAIADSDYVFVYAGWSAHLKAISWV